MAILAIGWLDGCIEQRKLSEGVGQGLCHGLMAVMRSKRFGVLRQAGCRRNWQVVRTALRDGHPSARPKPQGHQKQQEAKERATHCQIISQALKGSGCRARMTAQVLRSDKGVQATTRVVGGQKRLRVAH